MRQVLLNIVIAFMGPFKMKILLKYRPFSQVTL